MSGTFTIVVMSFLLGAASLGIGLLPLSFTFSRARLLQLSTLGTGLLLGAALGIIIPEGVENIASKHSTPSDLPTTKIAFSLLVGFTIMLVVEQTLSSHAHEDLPGLPHSITLNTPRITKQHSSSDFSAASSDHDFDVSINMHDFDIANERVHPGDPEISVLDSSNRHRALPLTLGLVIHSLADGLALGASALPASGGNTEASFELSLVVFFALLVHKAPTALALTTSLLSTSLSRPECRKHILLFSAATPIGALVSYATLSFLGAGAQGDWTGVALLVSGGSFLYVSTVLQPVSNHSVTAELGKHTRVGLIVLGMFAPFLVASVIGHGHGHGHDRVDGRL